MNNLSMTARCFAAVLIVVTGLTLYGCSDVSSVSTPPPPTGFVITSASPLPNGFLNIPYSNLQLATANGKDPVSWSLDATSPLMPAGLSLSNSGVISGTPTATTNGQVVLQIRAQDSSTPNAQVVVQGMGITVLQVPQPSIVFPSGSSLPNGIETRTYATTTLQASGGTGAYTWSQVIDASHPKLPNGLAFNAATATISGTPTSGTAGTTTHRFMVTDSFSPPQSATKDFTLTITTAPQPLNITTTNTDLPPGTVGATYKQTTLAASGGVPPYTWAITAPSGSTPAPGLTLTTSGPNAGLISGTPSTNSGSPFTRTYQVQDSDVPAKTFPKSLTISVGLPAAPKIATTSASLLPNGVFNVPYSKTLAVQSGTGTPPFSWSFTGGSPFPNWLSLNPSTGVISGTPNATGTFNFNVQVIDSLGQSDPAPPSLSITIDPQAPPVITPFTLQNGTVNVQYPTIQLTATGGIPPYKNWTVTPALPNGLQFNVLGPGIISGTPMSPAPLTNYTFTVTDSTVPMGQVSPPVVQSIAINAALNIDTTYLPPGSLPPGCTHQSYTASLGVSGGTPPYTWTTTTVPSLPTGLTIAPSPSPSNTATLSGTPTVADNQNHTFTVKDSTANPAATKSLSLQISAILAITTSSPLSSGNQNVPYGPVTLQACGGTPPYVWSPIVTPPLPTGMSISATGVISGTPTTLETAVSHTFTVTDSTPTSANRALSLTIGQ